MHGAGVMGAGAAGEQPPRHRGHHGSGQQRRHGSARAPAWMWDAGDCEAVPGDPNMVTADAPDESHGHPEHIRASIVPVCGALPRVLYRRGVTGPEAAGEPVLAG
jgi:hypothetical protein